MSLRPPHPADCAEPKVPQLDVPILLYHSLSTQAATAYRPFAVDPATFARQMDLLLETGRSVLTVGEFVACTGAGMALPPRPVVLTFDDGFRDFLTAGLPILAARELRATLYVVSGHVGGRSSWLARAAEGSRELLDWRELHECQACGIEIGAHSRTHPELDAIAPAAARNEIVLSKRILEERLGTGISTFAYPYGYHDERLRTAVVDAGYKSACAVKNALSSTSDCRFALARITVTADISPETFARLLEGDGVPRGQHGERLKTRAWRVVRRSRNRLVAPHHGTDRVS